jgi:tRNA1(Val) A37 N6-methylase TrmN6
MKPISLTKHAHSLIEYKIIAGAIVIDATVGNGHDTLFLAKQVGESGRVYGFDIQQVALEAARTRLQEANLSDCVTLILANHALMKDKIPVQYHGKISAIMFNLGYLPGGDKAIITLAESTLVALNNASQILSPKGIMTILAYPGHDGGDIETDQVKKWCGQLNKQQFNVDIFSSAENKNSMPVLFSIAKTCQ